MNISNYLNPIVCGFNSFCSHNIILCNITRFSLSIINRGYSFLGEISRLLRFSWSIINFSKTVNEPSVEDESQPTRLEQPLILTPPLPPTPIITEDYFRDNLWSIQTRKRRWDDTEGWVDEKRSPAEIVQEIDKISPENVSRDQQLNIIFRDKKDRNFLAQTLAEAIFSTNPELSSLNTLRKAILESEQLTNSELLVLLSKYEIDEEEEIESCFDLAKHVHPYSIYRLSDTPVLSNEYSLNFLWINLNPQDRESDKAENIFGDGLDEHENDESIVFPETVRGIQKSGELPEELDRAIIDSCRREGVKKSFTYCFSKWVDLHSGAEINLWYDSALVTYKAAMKTFKMLRKISQSRRAYVHLRDIRTIPMPNLIRNSPHPATPVYYRVDICKALIADYMMRLPRFQYTIISDVDVVPMTAEKIFDRPTMKSLFIHGYIFSDGENNFYIFNGKSDKVQKTHYEMVINRIDLNIFHQGQRELEEISERNKWHSVLGSESVWKEYIQFAAVTSDSDRTVDYSRYIAAPQSQFKNKKFSPKDHQAEHFRFYNDETFPYTVYGRSKSTSRLVQIPEFVNWIARPLVVRSKL